MIINIDTRIFNFIHKRLKGKYKTDKVNFLGISKTHLWISDSLSLLVIPCKNENVKEPLGLYFKTLKENLANKGKMLEIEFIEKEKTDYQPTLNIAKLNHLSFKVLSIKKPINWECVEDNFKKETKENPKEFSFNKEVFNEIFTNNNTLNIENIELKLQKHALNGLDREKGFKLLLKLEEKIRISSMFKIMQDDLILYEMRKSNEV